MCPLKKLTVNYAIRSTCFVDPGLEGKTHGNCDAHGTSGTRQKCGTRYEMMWPFCLPCAALNTRQIKTFAMCIWSLPSAVCKAHGKVCQKNLIQPSQIFLLCAYSTWCSLVNLGVFYSFTIFSDLICLIKFLAIKLEVFWVLEYNEPKKDIQVQEVNVMTYACTQSKFWRSCSRTMTRIFWRNRFKII